MKLTKVMESMKKLCEAGLSELSNDSKSQLLTT